MASALQAMVNQKMLRIYGNSKIGEFVGANEPFDQPDPIEDFHLFAIRPALVNDNSSEDGIRLRNGTVQIHPTFPIFTLSQEYAGEGLDLLCVDLEVRGTRLSAKNRLLYRCWGSAGYGLFTPLCHSHFDGKGACKVFALRSEFNGRLVQVTQEADEEDTQWKGFNLLNVCAILANLISTN